MGNLVIKMVEVAKLAWLAVKNYGRDESAFDNETERNSHSAQLANGWWVTQPVTGVKITEADKASYMEWLQNRWTALKGSEVETTFPHPSGTGSVVLTPSEMLRVFEDNWTNGKGKLIEPDFDMVFAFQRGFSLLGALALRFKLGIKGDFTVPIVETSFESEYERVTACGLENTGKTAGAKLIDSDWPSIVKLACGLRDSGRDKFKEIECIRTISGGGKMKRGTGQKAFYLAVLDARFPKLKIAELIRSSAESTEEKICGQELGKALDRNKLQRLEIGTRYPVPEKAEPKTEEDVAAYIANPRSDEGAGPQMAKRSDLMSAASNSSVLVLKFIAHCVTTSDLGQLVKLEKAAEELNAAFLKTGIKLGKASE